MESRLVDTQAQHLRPPDSTAVADRNPTRGADPRTPPVAGEGRQVSAAPPGHFVAVLGLLATTRTRPSRGLRFGTAASISDSGGWAALVAVGFMIDPYSTGSAAVPQRIGRPQPDDAPPQSYMYLAHRYWIAWPGSPRLAPHPSRARRRSRAVLCAAVGVRASRAERPNPHQ